MLVTAPSDDEISLDAHIRRANPRTASTAKNLIRRRGYNYDNGTDGNGRPNQGLIFICFQKNLSEGFITVQRRLDGEPLEKFIRPFGGGYFFVVPGTGADGYLGRQLIEAT